MAGLISKWDDPLEPPQLWISSSYAKITPVGDHSATSDDALANQLEHALAPYEAVLLVSFGGPESPEDVMPFLRNVTRGRGIPAERLAEVSQHYLQFGGRSPINDQCRGLLAALKIELHRRGIPVPLYWGNRNWKPYLKDELHAMQQAGHRRALAVVTSAYPSYSSCRQYRENLFDAAQGTQVQIDRIRHYANHPGFVAASVEACLKGLQALGEKADAARLVFVTHSIPMAMAETAGPTPRSRSGAYVDWHAAVAAEVTNRVSQRRRRGYDSDLVYCSRSGPASQPWLEPDINNHLRQLAAGGVSAVVVVPIGFISDHMEVVFDLDTEAATTAKECSMAFARAATAGTHPAFVAGLIDLMLERAVAARGEQPQKPILGSISPGWYECQTDCCQNLREPGRPALCEETD
jgi:ferrochelatase